VSLGGVPGSNYTDCACSPGVDHEEKTTGLGAPKQTAPGFGLCAVHVRAQSTRIKEGLFDFVWHDAMKRDVLLVGVVPIEVHRSGECIPWYCVRVLPRGTHVMSA
jgi:hypothetical protein